MIASTEQAIERAAERSRAYGALARAFSLPTPESHREIASGRLAEVLGAPDDPSLTPDMSFEELQAEYLRLFEVGTPRPPCSLYEGSWREKEFSDRRELMEELVRFYNYFGLTLGERPKELPDHLAIELEFMHFLAFREAQALADGRDPGSYRRARRDFLERHLARWLPWLGERLDSLRALPFFRTAAAVAEERVRSDMAKKEAEA
jgi:DMSO reductase family type II enzyme chaperone